MLKYPLLFVLQAQFLWTTQCHMRFIMSSNGINSIWNYKINDWLMFLPPLLKIASLKVFFFQMLNIKNEFFKKFTSAIFLLTFITNRTEWAEWKELPLATSLLIDVFVNPPTWSTSPLLWFAMPHILIIGMLYSSASCWTPQKWGQGFILTATVTTFYIMGHP